MNKAAQPPSKLRVSGVLLIDKPQGLTSQQVVSKVKYLFKSPIHDSKKAGHTGTLDPMATGLLPICLGEATKFSHYQLDADKSYEAIIKLGEMTDTGDAEGQVVQTASIPDLTQTDCDRVARQFIGAQTQIPPMYSALKKDGKKLYEYAREGIEIERQARAILLSQVELSLLSADSLKLKVTCSKGTYVRVLGEDIAKALGTIGHLTALRRTQVGDFKLADAIDLHTLENLSLEARLTQLLGTDACVAHLPVLALSDSQWQRVQVGQRLNVYSQLTEGMRDYLSQPREDENSVTSKLTEAIRHNSDTKISAEVDTFAKDIRLVNAAGKFIGLASLSLTGRLQPKKIIAL